MDIPTPPAAESFVSPDRSAQSARAQAARKASGRRRFVDPTTCERNYRAAEQEFMFAMHAYKASSGRLYPTWSEVLEVLVGLGYEQPASHGETRAAGLRAGGADDPGVMRA